MTDTIAVRNAEDAEREYPGVITPASAIRVALACAYVVRAPLTVEARAADGDYVELTVVIPGFPDGSPERRLHALVTRRTSVHRYDECCRKAWVLLRDTLLRSQHKRDSSW